MEIEKNDLVAVAKRENNKKRNYLVVNKLQGKHVPVSPKAALMMFQKLAQILKEEYKGETLLLIGFAETATAIGAELAIELDSYYIQTTREQIDHMEYLFFTEDHSHAREQKLVKKDIEFALEHIDRVIFIEDEITTGNTILGIVTIMESYYPKKAFFSVASLLNGMDQNALTKYKEKKIKIHYLWKTSHAEYTKLAESYRCDGISYKKCIDHLPNPIQEISISGYKNTRRLVKGAEYLSACEYLWKQIAGYININDRRKILVLGTEEFMFPSLFIGRKLEEAGQNVKCHASTRSPIMVSTEHDYPLHKRYELASMYEQGRDIFLYDLAEYDDVFVITDAENLVTAGVTTLAHALFSCGNKTIWLFRWCKD